MDPAELAADAAELRRLEECAKEPIRTPGRIQSHGTLLVVDPLSSRVVAASADAAEWLGRELTEAGDEELAHAARTSSSVDPVRILWNGTPTDAIVHRTGTRAVVELEPAVLEREYARTGVVGAIQRLSALSTIPELRRAAVAEIHDLTGFDRVMMYHFHPDGHGEVVADHRHPDLEPYLGLHFPSSDIPPQARDLYVSKISRAIVDTEDPGTPILATEGDAAELDLSHAELRAVSPYHLAYMRNMGQASTVSLSLVADGQLVGMITCAHRTPRRLPVLLRRALEVLAGQLSMQLAAIGEIERLRHRLEVRERRAALLAPLYASDDIAGALLGGARTVLDLVPADGVLVRIDGVIRTAGAVPPAAGVERVLAAIGDEPFVTECVEREHPEYADDLPGVAGMLVVPLDDLGDTIVFFRAEFAHEVSWLGDPGVENRPDELSPRTSFAEWRHSVSGRSQPWDTLVDEAAELGLELSGALQRRAEARLAELALRDALTGLYNRRFLDDRLGAPGRDGAALLFVDLDDFKLVNDEHGHEVGDAVLVEVARRLVTHSRAQDAVVRLGGDEFVVLCEGLSADAVPPVAERVLQAVAAPVLVGARVIAVTASIGVVVADGETPRAGMLDAADAAMYRAKRAGRNRVSG